MNKPIETRNSIGKKVLINQVGCYGINLGKIDFYFSESSILEKSNIIKV
jgi:5'-nucleotidase